MVRLGMWLAVLGLWGGTVVAAGKSPNVVLIVSDDHAWGDYSFMGHPHVRTPRIDRLASEGTTFRRGYVPSSLCSPSLATILTGLYAHQHKLTSNDPPGTSNRNPAEVVREGRRRMVGFIEAAPTLPKLLAERGYDSFQAGKWWGGNFRTGGFTEGMTHGDPAHGGRHGDDGLAIGRRTMQPVFDFIDRSVDADRPFFLWYAPMMPHQPHTPPERLLAKYRDQTSSLHVAKYWAMIEWFDETCGALLDHLDAREIADDTIVVYLADNGWIQDPDAPRFAPRSKRSPYDGGLRTPILVRWPGKARPAMIDQPVSSIDLAPTILKAIGAEPTPDMQGIDLLDPQAVARREAVFGEVFTHDAVDLDRPAASLTERWTVAGDWKLIVPDPRNAPDAPLELFHLAADPDERQNLADREPEKTAELTRLLDAWWSPAD
ncbi:sulfatase [Planctomyces sp. SH-PL62]|uniref:sulfatase family protein n=1 Tax=Planctomyces sp. SH-PL62 TaxID=1636152 RepID=UPI00078E23B1|nr:sulfatase [Planctomyces sp. SH-PL62]AMV37346.1 Arylsulfatase precursor [Planctomyces sp. SH-PL62]